MQALGLCLCLVHKQAVRVGVCSGKLADRKKKKAECSNVVEEVSAAEGQARREKVVVQDVLGGCIY